METENGMQFLDNSPTVLQVLNIFLLRCQISKTTTINIHKIFVAEQKDLVLDLKILYNFSILCCVRAFKLFQVSRPQRFKLKLQSWRKKKFNEEMKFNRNNSICIEKINFSSISQFHFSENAVFSVRPENRLRFQRWIEKNMWLG